MVISQEVQETIPPTKSRMPAIPQNLDFPQEYARHVSTLTTVQRQVLLALAQNMVSDEKKPEIQIAEELHIDPATIWRCRQTPAFQYALSAISMDIIRGLTDKAVNNLLALKGNVKAQEILLRIAEVYNPTQRLLTLSGKMPGQAVDHITNSRQIVSKFVEKLAQLGYDRQRIIAEVQECYDELKETGSI